MSHPIQSTERLLLIVLIGSVIGCFSARDARPLDAGEPVAPAVPILPVLASQVRITVTAADKRPAGGLEVADAPREDYQRVADLVNEILDTVTREHAGLVGPTQVLSSLPETTVERLFVYLDDPGPLDEAWKVRGLEAISRQLGADWIVRMHVQLLLEEQPFDDVTDPMNRGWNGQAKVTAEILGLNPVSLVALGEGQDSVWGNIGVIAAGGYGGAIVAPYAVGRGLGKSIDNATREALGAAVDAMGELR